MAVLGYGNNVGKVGVMEKGRGGRAGRKIV